MSETSASKRIVSPFGRRTILAVLVVGFGAFLAMLYFVGIGDTSSDRANPNAHASSNAIHGYSALVQLLEANGLEVEKSRLASGLETTNLLVITPPLNADPEEINELLERREFLGPTLIILPKWRVGRPLGEIADEDKLRVRDDWVQLVSAATPQWTSELSEPFTFRLGEDATERTTPSPSRWAGLGLAGSLPNQAIAFAKKETDHTAIVVDPNGRTLAFDVTGQETGSFDYEANWLTVIVEPDLMNNYGLADPSRAALALKIIEEAGYDESRVTFDLTLVGIGGSINLLTLAFQPPFLAATICLILAMVIVGWRALLRFGPVAAAERETSFGKSQLVKNGAGLITRARRLTLLAAPYIALNQRKLGRALGLSKPSPEAIDAALAQRMPDEEPFSMRAAKLKNASRAGEFVRAAQFLDELVSKMRRKSDK